MTDPDEINEQEGSESRTAPGLTPVQRDWVRRTLAALDSLGDVEHLWRARRSESAPQEAPDGTTARFAVILVRDFRLPEVLAHLEAGRIVIVVPAPRSD